MPDDVSAILARKRSDLEGELTQLEKPGEDNGGISFGKRVGEGTSIAVERLSQVAVHDGLGLVLTEVARAQDKLTEGSYGSCDACGAPIPAERLAALPWATRCVACASRR
ncbi:MAG: TraR/DksA C4-type zinc finger protein [Mycobacteriales bacterium]